MVDRSLSDQFLDGAGKRGLEVCRASEVQPVEMIPSGLYRLDKEVIGGGIPLGRMVEIAGEAYSGKTTFAQCIATRFQERGLGVAWIDAESSFDASWAQKSGLDTSKVLYTATASAEDLLNTVKKLSVIVSMEYGGGVVIVDSVMALNPAALIDREDETVSMNLGLRRATILTQFCRDMMGPFQVVDKDIGINGRYTLRSLRTTILFINHMKEGQPDFMGRKREYTPGGTMPEFAMSLRLWLYKAGGEHNKDTGTLLKRKVRFRAEKTRFCPPDSKITLLLNHETARYEEDYKYILDCLSAAGKATRKGAWYELWDGQRFNGVGQFEVYCQQHSEAVVGYLDTLSTKKAEEVVPPEEPVGE